MGPFVLDASALVEFLLARERTTPFDDYIVPGADLHVPAICDVEVFAAIRRLVLAGSLDDEGARNAILDYVSLALGRHLHPRLLGRMYELRTNFSATDAGYVALAEALDADLVTADRSLARATSRHTRVRGLP